MREKKKSKKQNRYEPISDGRSDEVHIALFKDVANSEKWLRENLFTHYEFYFDNKLFPCEVVLYSNQLIVDVSEHLQNMEKLFTREDLYNAVVKACETLKRKTNAYWFQINIIDQAVWTFEGIKKYPYPLLYPEKPLATPFWQLEKYPAEQRGTTYIGVLSEDVKWLLLIEHGVDAAYTLREETDFKIRFLGPDYLCKMVSSFLKTKAK